MQLCSFTYYEDVSMAGFQGEGSHTILDWGQGHDKLVFAGLSADATAANYYGNFLSRAET